MSDRQARLLLSHLVEPGSWPVHHAVGSLGVIEVVARLRAGRPVPGVPSAVVQAAAARGQLSAPLAQAMRDGARVLVPGDEEWPDDLSWTQDSDELAAPPLVLLVRGTGRLDQLASRGVAIVGARACSTYGTHMTGRFALDLAEQGRAVVSGGAYGIDAAAHRGALLADEGQTVAVLACGVDVPYPRGNERLLEQVAERGLLVSEVLPGTRPTRLRFLVRNRLIAALSQGTVVIEAALRSGSLSTANRAAELSRPVMAVPGPVTSAMSAGCHLLVRDRHACLVTSAKDVLALVAPPGEHLPERQRGAENVRDGLSDTLRRVLDALPVRGGWGEARIAQAAGVPVLVVQQCLPPLQVHGLVRRSDTGWVLTPLGAGREDNR